tara:strand:- start:255 stop:626 length:372 start_codon:yes stop_codon:yes gene_type:complete
MSLKKKLFCFDLDGVICKNTKYRNSNLINYNKSKPIPTAVKAINKLYDDGHTIVIYTARGMTRYNGNISLVKKKLFKITANSLKSWKLNYHKLILGKIYYDFIIDDKSINYSPNWAKVILKKI